MDTKTLSIIGLVVSFIIPLAGIIVCAIALKQFKEQGITDGKGFAVAGLVIGIVFMVFSIILASCLGCLGALAGAAAGGY